MELVTRRDCFGLIAASKLYAVANDMGDHEACDVLVTLGVQHGLQVFDTSGSSLPQGPLDKSADLLFAVYSENWWKENYDEDRLISGFALRAIDVAFRWVDVESNFGLERTKGSPLTAGSGDAMAEMVDHPFWPEELGIALTAWRAACNNAERESKRPGAYIRDWLAKHHPTLSGEAVKRIATVANWNKAPGAAKK